ncbi:MAG: type II toxin-antitoxin system VapC family toxin [Actinomycetota bacterium]
MSTYLLDTTVLIAHFRGKEAVSDLLLRLLRQGHTLATSCVNVAEIERGTLSRERKAVRGTLDRLRYLETSREAAMRAGRYQSEFQRRGVTIHTPDALIAGTARVHGAIIVTDDTADFPMRDVRCEAPGHVDTR